MLNVGASALAWRWLLPAAPFLVVAARLVRGVWVIRAFEQQRKARRRSRRGARASPSCLCVADALHKPLVALSAAAIALRLAFFLLAVGGDQVDASMLYFWLAQAPSVAYVALCAYLALLMLVVVCTGHWPGTGNHYSATKRRTSLVVAAAAGACLVFCALLVAAITLLAITRNMSLSSEQRRHHPRLVDNEDELLTSSDGDALTQELRGLARAAVLYLAFVWSVLGLLLLRAQANATRVLLGYDHDAAELLPQRRDPDPDKTIPPVFVMKLSRGVVLLALLLLLRGVYSAAIALLCDSKQLARWFFLTQGGRWSVFWSVIVLDLCWELLALLAVVSLLKTMPLAVYLWPSPALRARAATTESTAETDATDPTDESDETDEVDETELLLPPPRPSSPSASTPVVGFRFQLSTLHELVQDYVIVTRQSLTRRLSGADDVIYTYAHGEPERCVHQEPSSSSPRAHVTAEEAPEVAGSEFMECQCPQRRRQEPVDLLPDAQVPLLSDEELADESFEVIDALSDTHSDDSQVLSASS